MTSAKKKKQKKTKKGMKIIPMPAAESASENEEKNEDESGMYLEKEEIKLIYNALSKYKPSEREAYLHGVLIEEFEEILVVDYNEPYPDVNYSKFTG
jgi:hypothetical protein